MHILLFVGDMNSIWGRDLLGNVFDKHGEKKLVQLWLSIGDSRYANCQYNYFEEKFVKPMMCLLGCDKNFSLSPEINKFLRLLQFNEVLGIDHNQGD